MSQSSSQPVLNASLNTPKSMGAVPTSSSASDKKMSISEASVHEVPGHEVSVREISVREVSDGDSIELNVSDPGHHPLPTGFIFTSPGRHFTYRVIGPCCQLFDREELPWPCCRIQWHSKEPSWRRIGRRFVADIAAKRCPSYSVEILNQEYSQDPFVLTMYWVKFPPDIRDWWYSKIRTEAETSGMG